MYFCTVKWETLDGEAYGKREWSACIEVLEWLKNQDMQKIVLDTATKLADKEENEAKKEEAHGWVEALRTAYVDLNAKVDAIDADAHKVK